MHISRVQFTREQNPPSASIAIHPLKNNSFQFFSPTSINTKFTFLDNAPKLSLSLSLSLALSLSLSLLFPSTLYSTLYSPPQTSNGIVYLVVVVVVAGNKARFSGLHTYVNSLREREREAQKEKRRNRALKRIAHWLLLPLLQCRSGLFAANPFAPTRSPAHVYEISLKYTALAGN